MIDRDLFAKRRAIDTVLDCALAVVMAVGFAVLLLSYFDVL